MLRKPVNVAKTITFSFVIPATLLLGVVCALAQTVSEPGLQVSLVAGGLSQPTSMAFIGLNDMLVLQKADGRVRRIVGGVLQPGFVLDVAVDSNSERGLLGITVDPDFAVSRRVFLYYTESGLPGVDTAGQTTPLGNRVYQYLWDGAGLVSPSLVLDLPVLSGPNHDAGVITFGPDGALYAIIGDLNLNGQLQNNPSGPDPDDSGVILRVDLNGQGLADNPFFTPADPAARMNRYFAYGIRNSFGMAFDGRTGQLWDTENGPNSYDEVNRIVRGFNSGWNQLMGPDARDPQGVADIWVAPGSTYRDPAFSWNATVAPTALIFPASPVAGCALQNDLLVGDNNCGQLYRFQLNAARDDLAFATMPLLDQVADNLSARCSDEMGEILFGSGFGAVTDLENGPDGMLYLVSLTLGGVFRIGPRPGAFPDPDGDGVDSACDCAPGSAAAFAAPREIPRLRVAADAPRTIFWDEPFAAAGPGTASTLVSGDVAALRTSGGYAAACTLAQGLPGASFDDPRADPPPGSARFYLVRPENACGTGTFGSGSGTPDPRDLIDATLPAPCGP